MKKLRILAALCLVLLCLAGCRRSNITTNFGPDLAHWKASGEAPESREPRPSEVVDTSGGDFAATLGFTTSLPSGGGLTLNQSFAIDGWFGQLEFNTPAPNGGDPWLLVVRVARAEGALLTGLYNEPHGTTNENVTIGGLTVNRRTASAGCALDTWTKGDFQYTLHSNKLQGAVPEAMLEALVAGLDSSPA